ncbi:MAG: 1-acyl-sn-glycerol-3-phosphate acyltransferase [Deltaproteobacteria bacterium]|nr:1-acyl-sn-glycerol-3-phosphate acyltransferase [Deltaproteobacteria bacterium]
MLRKIYLIGLNSLLWGFFVVTSMVLDVGAAILRVVTAPFDPNLKILQQYTCFWSSLYIWFNPFWRLRKKGLEKVDRSRTYVIVANHQSLADILCIFNTWLHFKWVAKASLFKAPLLGWNMWLNGYIPIDRGNAESRDRCLNACKKWLAKGSSVFFFPEGSRSEDGKLRPFKVGAFRLALDTGHDILPIVIQDSLYAVPKYSRLLSGKSKMRMEVLDPISIAPYRDMGPDEGASRLSDAVRAAIAARMGP